MKKIFILIIMSMFLISLVQAESNEIESIGTIKSGDCIEIMQTCVNCTYNNITSISYPDLTKALGLTAMIQNGDYYNYSFCDTENIGWYLVSGNGDEYGVKTGWRYRFESTPSGLSQSTPQAIGSAVFLFLMIFLTILFEYTGFKLSNSDKLWIPGLFFMFFSILMMVYDTWLGYEYHHVLTGFTNSSMPETIFYILMFILVAGILASLALLFLQWKKVFKYIKREVKRKENYNEVEDWDIDEWTNYDWGIKK